MYELTKKQKLDFILKKIEELELTSYDIGKKTNLSISGIEKIINGTSKNPHEETLNKILGFLENKVIGTNIGNNNEVNEPPPVYSRDTMEEVKNNPLVIALTENNRLTREIIILQSLLRENKIPFKNIFEKDEK
ncbi:hypothetical protein D3C86_1375890 [compost metagenome]